MLNPFLISKERTIPSIRVLYPRDLKMKLDGKDKIPRGMDELSDWTLSARSTTLHSQRQGVYTQDA